ncbi:MAG: tRNA epoxyqueuosine(34) reductase QueG [Planctomycetaceae bacterium]|nr:tRNA epoxyqueuosine(34) reductase QueG [Planctomycetaceae bacterium]
MTTPDPALSPEELADIVREASHAAGFDRVGIAPAVHPDGFESFTAWLERGFAGEMRYLERRRNAYGHPQHVLESVRSVIMLGMNYRTADPPDVLAPGQARVSRYAWGSQDYHTVIREGLNQLADVLHQQAPGCRTRGVVDTAPLLERDFARLAGLGWFGKNTMLINKRQGSWLFLAALLTDVTLTPDAPHATSHCGTCTRCLDACPTNAFPEPYVLDATKCISYLTIELRDRPIPESLRAACGDWLFGCDICQDVCPWNRKAPLSTSTSFEPLPDLHPADAAALLSLDEAAFEARFANSPLARPGRAGLLRNACIVLGNNGDANCVPALTKALDDPEPLIRTAAAWALGRLNGDETAPVSGGDSDLREESSRKLA